MSEKRPLNGFFVCIYYLVNLVAGILHPVTIIGRENLPEHGALLIFFIQGGVRCAEKS